MFAAVLDTCDLWPSLQRDFLPSLAAEGVYRPLWSDRILEAFEYEEARKLEARGAGADDARTRATALIGRMNSAFNDSCVTMNTEYFPADHLPSSIRIQTQAQFALNTVEVSPTAAAVAVRTLADRSGRQGRKRSPQRILDDEDRVYTMTEATSLIRPLIT